MSKRVKASGVPRVQDWDRARYSIVPPRSALDGRLTVIHTKILIYLGRANSDDGWCEMSQAIFAKDLGYNEGSVSRAVRELVQWEYLDKKGQKETGSVHCHYRVRIEKPNIANDGETTENTTFDVVRDTSPEGDRYDVVRDTGRTQDVKPVSPHKQTLLRSSDHKNSIGRANALPDTTQKPSEPKAKRGTRLPDDFIVPADWREQALREHPSLDIDAQARRFTRYWQSAGGQKACKVNWRLAWLHWCDSPLNQSKRAFEPSHAEKVADYKRKIALL